MQESKSTLQREDSDWILKRNAFRSIAPQVLGSTTACVLFFFFWFGFFGARRSNEVYVAANFSHQQEDEERSEGAGSLQ